MCRICEISPFERVNCITKGVMTRSLRMTSLGRGRIHNMTVVSGRVSESGKLPPWFLYTLWVSYPPHERICPLPPDVVPLPWSVKGIEGHTVVGRDSWISFLVGICRKSLIPFEPLHSLLLASGFQLAWLHWSLVSVSFANLRNGGRDGLWRQGWQEGGWKG